MASSSTPQTGPTAADRSGPAPPPRRPRLLLVEDNFLMALNVQTMLQRFGYEVIGPVASVQQALHRLQQEQLDGAVLDVNIIDGDTAAVAQWLVARGLPFFFLTGYSSPLSVGTAFDHIPRLRKPIDERALRQMLERMFPVS